MNWIPSIEVESAHGTREVSLTTRHLMNRAIFLTGGIDSEVANSFLSQLLYLEEKDEPITVYINSPGGEVNSGLMIYDAIQGSIPVLFSVKTELLNIPTTSKKNGIIHIVIGGFTYVRKKDHSDNAYHNDDTCDTAGSGYGR